MTTDLDHENQQLRQRLRTFTIEASNNEALLNKFHERELALLSSDSLAELLISMTEGLKLSFLLDDIRLVLHDPGAEVRKLLEHTNVSAECLPNIDFVDSIEAITCYLRGRNGPWLGPCMSGRHGSLLDTNDSNSVAILPLKLRDKLIGCLAMGSNDNRRFTRHHATDFLQKLMATGSVCLENAINRERIVLSGLTDSLTGFYNRAYLDRRLNEEISRAARYQQPLSCLFMDIDYFKKVNDTYGHASGDLVLQIVANRIKNQLRASDIPIRFGGEEFTVLLPQTCSDEAMLLAERIRQAVQQSPVNIETGEQLNTSISIGVSQILAHNHEQLAGLGEKLLHDADSALYNAKESGRNKAVLAAQMP